MTVLSHPYSIINKIALSKNWIDWLLKNYKNYNLALGLLENNLRKRNTANLRLHATPIINDQRISYLGTQLRSKL